MLKRLRPETLLPQERALERVEDPVRGELCEVFHEDPHLSAAPDGKRPKAGGEFEEGLTVSSEIPLWPYYASLFRASAAARPSGSEADFASKR